jgi:hypothetical protein
MTLLARRLQVRLQPVVNDPAERAERRRRDVTVLSSEIRKFAEQSREDLKGAKACSGRSGGPEPWRGS